MMVDGEFRNIKKLEYEKTFVESYLPDFIFLIDILSEQFFLVGKTGPFCLIKLSQKSLAIPKVFVNS